MTALAPAGGQATATYPVAPRKNHQDAIMSRQDANAAFALSSFLQGANATYIDELYARYEKDPASVDGEWQEFFKSLKDPPADILKNADGPSWERNNWPLSPRDDLTSALDGNWAEVEKVVGGKIA